MGNSRLQLHIINPFRNPYGGSERRALGLYELLKTSCDIHLWSEEEPDPYFSNYDIKMISLAKKCYPKRGTFVFVGVYFPVGIWVHLAVPNKIIIIYNTCNTRRLKYYFWRLSHLSTRNIEVVYASTMMQHNLRYPGSVEMSPIDLDVFKPHDKQSVRQAFTIGRMSRDIPAKHHENDPEIYKVLEKHGVKTRIMGGTCIAEKLSGMKNITILPAGKEDASQFLQKLDCFYYRTSSEFIEPHGRVITEAMACGLPVVCHIGGGYREFIRNEENGFLFETDEQAVEMILRLKNDVEKRMKIGKSARRTVENMFGSGYVEMIKRYYCHHTG